MTRAPTTRFAPAPTGRLHLGHLANAIFVWGTARGRGGRVLLRIEDHDRQRCRPEFEAAILDDLDRLGIAADEPSTDELRAGASWFRQSDNRPVYEAAFATLRAGGFAYACDCSRATFERWASAAGRAWSGPGCPGRCAERDLDLERAIPRPGHAGDLGIRVALGDGAEGWHDTLRGPSSGLVAPGGDLLIADRNGNWTYGLCVVVDDIRHGIDLVVRGVDLIDATAAQIRLGRLLGRVEPPTFAHHPLVLRPDGSKLSKADGDTSVAALLDAGRTPADLFGLAAAAVGLRPEPSRITLEEVVALVRGAAVP